LGLKGDRFVTDVLSFDDKYFLEEDMKRKMLFLALFLELVSVGIVCATGTRQAGGAVATTKPTIVLAESQNAFITDYENNYLTQLLERKLDVNIDFYMLPTDSNERQTKIALMVVSNDLTDILLPGLPAEQVLDYGGNGAFISLNKWLADPQMAPNYTKIKPELRPLITSAITSADGNIYGFPQYQPETWNLAHHRMWINTSWLDKLGLKVPSTTEELKNVLLAFRDKDPNSNGRKDEIGITQPEPPTGGEA
jgi:putative aldouronate transport system substrate-binding protein